MHPRLVGVGPSQPGLLHHILGVGRGAEQLGGNGEEQAAVGDERSVITASLDPAGQLELACG